MPKYQWDACDPTACFEIIFGNGEDFRTGQASGPGTIKEQWEVGAVQKSPFGPGTASWHRLIQGAQGTLGIVTWASMRCEILPSLEEPFVVGGDRLNKLLDMAYWLIRLRMVNECFILNNTNLAAILATKGADYQKIKATLPAWTLFYTVAGYEVFPEERVSAHIKDITKVAQRLVVEPVKTVGAISAAEILKTVQQPCEDPYWKLRTKGACEDICFITLYDKIEKQIAAMNEVVEKAGYPVSDMGVYIQPATQGTSYHCEFNLFYDPANSTELNRVKTLSTAAVKELLNQGAFFSRPYGENARLITNRDAASVALLNKLKKMFDPNKIMNPGKAGF